MNYLSIINEDHELLNENFYFERFYDMNAKHNKINQILKFIGVNDIKHIDLKSANNDKEKTHLYICYKPSYFVLENDQEFFSEELLESMRKNNNIKILYLMLEETLEESDLIILCDYFNKKNIHHNQIVIYSNGANLDDITEKIGFKSIVYRSSYLMHFFLKLFKENNIDFQVERKFVFLSQNRRFRRHRFLLLSFLHNKKFLEETDWSLMENPFYDDKEIIDIRSFYNISKDHFKDVLLDFCNYIKNTETKKSFYESELTVKKIEKLKVCKESFINSYINLTTETNFIESSIHITEKSFKPFFYYQIPIIISNSGHIKKMREIFDFDFFDDLIDHGYDNEQDNYTRINKIFDQILKIYNNKSILKEFYTKNFHRFEKNKQILLNYNKHKDCNFFYNI